jgi:hypothetical protein
MSQSTDMSQSEASPFTDRERNALKWAAKVATGEFGKLEGVVPFAGPIREALDSALAKLQSEPTSRGQSDD